MRRLRARSVLTRSLVPGAALALLVAGTPSAAAGAVGAEASGPHDDSTVLVGFGPGADTDLVHELADVGEVASEITEIAVHVVEVPVGTVESAINVYEGLPGVTYAEPNFAQETHEAPNDPLLDQQYQLDHIAAVPGFELYNDAVDAEPYAPTGGATLAILDSGIDLTHPELASKVVECASYLTTTGQRVDATCQDANFHGTYVAGIASAITDNAQGIAGVGFDADLFVYQVCTLVCFTADSASAMVDAAVRGADAANYSFGGANPNATSRRAVDFAHSEGMLQVASAGNSGREGPDSVGFPAAYPEVVAVAATDRNKDRASFSSYGPEVDVTAPGVGILSTIPGGGYSDRFSGTSFSGPAVAGLGALLRNLGLDHEQAAQAIIDGADPAAVGETGFSEEHGHGMADVEASVQIALDMLDGSGDGADERGGPPEGRPGAPERP
jgi:subtilisin family serine protease